MLKDLTFETEYDSIESDALSEFLVPALTNSVKYDRAVGYFSSAIFAALLNAFTDFAERGGKMRLVCSPFLSMQDATELKNHDTISYKTHFDALLRGLMEDNTLSDPMKFMSAMIQMGALEIKIAIPKPGEASLFHQKIGIFTDSNSDQVYFQGSSNETLTAWDQSNSESFTVHTSWGTRADKTRVENNGAKFERFWNSKYPSFDFLPLDEASQYFQTRSNEETDFNTLKSRVRKWVKQNISTKRQPADPNPGVKLYDYQELVLKDWFAKSCVGVVSFATGAGKTITALEAIHRWQQKNTKNKTIILVPSQRLQKQWLSEIRKFGPLISSSVLLVGGLNGKANWENAISGYTLGTSAEPENAIVLAVMKSASSGTFVNRVSWGENLLVVADEMHNLGAPSYRKLLDEITKTARLGLTATPERFDETETALLRDVFGPDLDPVVDITKAQELGVLVPYVYKYDTVSLNFEEDHQYVALTMKINQLYAISKQRKLTAKQLKDLQDYKIDRAKILRKAEEKIQATVDILNKEFVEGQYWLVFCADQEQLNHLKTRLAHFKPFEYFSDMTGDFDATLLSFRNEGGVLLVINMLDEGVDIPEIDCAILVASTQNARQYIQRRGRILRRNPKKSKIALVWDLFVLNSKNYVYSKAEVIRGLEFAGTATNSLIAMEISELIEPGAEIIDEDFKRREMND